MFWIIVLAFLLACTNVILNLAIALAVSQSPDWVSAFFSRFFYMAVATGICSLLLIVTLYHLAKYVNFGMANIVLMIGAISILGGSIAGVVLRGDVLHWTEWALLMLVTGAMIIRYFFISSGRV